MEMTDRRAVNTGFSSRRENEVTRTDNLAFRVTFPMSAASAEHSHNRILFEEYWFADEERRKHAWRSRNTACC